MFRKTFLFVSLILLFTIASLLTSCGTTSTRGASSRAIPAEFWLESYKAALEIGDAGAVADLYDEDGVLTVFDPYAGPTIYRGAKKIERFYREKFSKGRLDFYDASIEVDGITESKDFDAEISASSSDDRILFDWILADSNPAAEAAVSRHMIRFYPRQGLAATSAQKWADWNEDGFIDIDERKELIEAVRNFTDFNRPAETPLDQYFDLNGNSMIEMTEWGLATYYLAREVPRKQLYPNPGLMVRSFKTDLSIHDFNELSFIFFDRNIQTEMTPHQVGPDYDRDHRAWLQDFDDDGIARCYEQEALIEWLYGIIAMYPEEPSFQWVIETGQQQVLEKCDLDGNGLITGKEITDGAWELSYIPRVLVDGEENNIDNAIHGFFDADGDLYLSVSEAEAGTDLIYGYLLEEAYQRGIKGYMSGDAPPKQPLLDFNGNGVYDKEDQEILKGYTLRWGDFKEREVIGQYDVLLDVNGDKYLDYGEFEDLNSLVYTSALIALMSVRCDELAAHGYGISRQSFPLGISVGTGAGVIRTAGGRSELAEELKNRTVAVVGISSRSGIYPENKAVDFLPFIENGFVNTRLATMLDRKNLEAIMDEYDFQSSGLVDERTAVQIGRLSGADVIVLPGLQDSDETVYLHLKVLSVEDGRILASSIIGKSPDMSIPVLCEAAVQALFTDDN